MACRSIAHRLLMVSALALLPLSISRATSIVAKLEKRRIILAVDTRQDRSRGADSLSHSFQDDGCKIIALGTAAMAVGGAADYKRDSPTDGLADWSALSDAAEALALHEHDLRAMAGDWAERGKSHFMAFYRFAPERVKKLASANPEGILAHAFIIGWSDQNEPLLIWEKVYFDESSSPMIRKRGQVLPYRELPYTSNATTQELFEGTSERTQRAEEAWRSKSQKVPALDRDWRWLEFLIQLTSTYDETVGTQVNILQIPAGGRAEWFQKLNCQM